MTNIGTKFLLGQRFVFDPNSNSLADQNNDNEIVRLGSNESRILLMLAERPNEVITRHELHEFVWREQGFEVDDSSLTQAISTLRKTLQDSTKSPRFVKTVPKRGYQLICPIEHLSFTPSEPAPEPSEVHQDLSIGAAAPITPTHAAPQITSAIPMSAQADKTPTPKHVKIFITLGLLVSLLLPVYALLFTPPAHSTFNTIGKIHNISIMTPIHHPKLNDWLPTIKQCITHHEIKHQGEPKLLKVIVTGGENHKLILNYIHDVDHAYKNTTLHIFAIQHHSPDICK